MGFCASEQTPRTICPCSVTIISSRAPQRGYYRPLKRTQIIQLIFMIRGFELYGFRRQESVNTEV